MEKWKQQLSGLRRDFGEHDAAEPEQKDLHITDLAGYLEEYIQKEGLEYSKLESLKLRLHKNFPDRAQEIEVLCGFADFLTTQKEVVTKRETGGDTGDEISALSEYQFLLIHFIRENPNRAYLGHMWNYFGSVGNVMSAGERTPPDAEQMRKFLPMMRTGILGQVAVEYLCEDAGLSPQTSTPKEDVKKKIDLWVRSKQNPVALQIKASSLLKKLEIYGERRQMPPVTASFRGGGRHFFDKLFRDINAFQVKVKKYGKELGYPIKAYAVAIPRDEIDPMTGVPSSELKHQFRRQVKEVVR